MQAIARTSIRHVVKRQPSYSITSSQTRHLTLPEAKARIAKMTAQPPAHEMVHFEKILTETRKFGDFRRVLHTSLYSQLVAMEIPVGGDIGDEVHIVDQVLLFTSGSCRATVAGKNRDIAQGDVVVVPAGTQHQFVNTGQTPLELVTVYSPAEHDMKTCHKTKEEGDKLEENGKDEPPGWSQQSKKENEAQGHVHENGKY